MKVILQPHAGHTVWITDEGELRCLSCMETLPLAAETPGEAEASLPEWVVCKFCGERPRRNAGDDLCQDCTEDDDIQWCERGDHWVSVPHDGQCPRCEACDDHCHCATCDACEEWVDEEAWCSECCRCEDCGCTCGEEDRE